MPVPTQQATISLVVENAPVFQRGTEGAVTLLIVNEGSSSLTPRLPFAWGDGSDGVLTAITLQPGARRTLSLPHVYAEPGSYEFTASAQLGSVTMESAAVHVSLTVNP